MLKVVMCFGIMLLACAMDAGAQEVDVSQLLDRCAANLDKLRSWHLKCEVLTERSIDGQEEPNSLSIYDLRFDGVRLCNRRWWWMDAEEARKEDLDLAGANYLSLTWDGQTHRKYHKGGRDDPGTVLLDDLAAFDEDGRAYEIGSLQYQHYASFATGYFGGTFERIDKVLRHAQTLSLRDELEEVNGIPCYVLDGETSVGDLTVWIDPQHGFAVARRQIEVNKAAGHIRYGKALRFDTSSETVEILRFEQFDGAWLGTKAIRRQQRTGSGKEYKDTSHVTITEFVLDPDHEALGSFEMDDVPNGTLVIVIPVGHIRYVWHDGELIKHVDDDVVAQIDGILETMMPTDNQNGLSIHSRTARDEDAVARADEPNEVRPPVRQVNPHLGPRAHCGLYCIYSLLKLRGLDPDFRDLVVPEYFGRTRGSSMAELNQAAHDYGFHAGVAARLSTRALRQSPCQAILHVKAQPNARDYDHYALYLGTAKGKAKLFSPPEEPRLVDFADLAPVWDGYALFISERPFDIDTFFRPDRERLYFYGMSAVLLVLLIHVGRRCWLVLAPMLSRRWVLGLTAGQAAALALVALLFGGFYHFFNDEGYLANPVGAVGVQRAHASNFIPKISAQKARTLLGKDAVVIDARYARDYERGHLKDAINLPVDVNDATWEATISTIPRGRPVVAYCQSARCKYAERIGLKLIDEGFDNIVIFKGGWVDWVKRYGEPETPQKEAEKNADDDLPV